MATVEVFGDAEVTCLEYLRSRIPTLAWPKSGPELPEKFDGERDEFVRVIRIGGRSELPVRDNPRLDVEVWGPDRGTAQDTMQQILAELSDAPRAGGSYGGQVIYRSVIEMGLGYVPDPVTDAHRWVATVALTTRPA